MMGLVKEPYAYVSTCPLNVRQDIAISVGVPHKRGPHGQWMRFEHLTTNFCPPLHQAVGSGFRLG